MSGHSKWHSIKHKKGAADAKRGKIFTKHAKLITIAARDGGDDPEMNPGLRTAIANAKADNVPNANIEKAIIKGAGGSGETSALSESMYEGFGPAGVALYVQTVTDNKNRAVSSIKNAFSKNGGNMGEAGCTAWMFEKKGLIFADIDGKNHDEAELEAIDAGAEDIDADGSTFEITTNPAQLMKVRELLANAGFSVEQATLSYVPKNTVKINNADDAKKVLKLVEALEDEDDVTNVYSNFDIPSDIIEKIS
ncbi:MAG: YebC/PmpR family DNA-binding transcriptional regulator [Candidatus Peregrinibacteria bacterium]